MKPGCSITEWLLAWVPMVVSAYTQLYLCRAKLVGEIQADSLKVVYI